MSKSEVNIIDFKVLYNILFEVKEFLNFNIFTYENESFFLDKIKKDNSLKNSIILSKKSLSADFIDPKKIIYLDNLPINFMILIDKINTSLLKQKYNFQSNISIKDYKLNLNSRVISKNKIELKLTEREIDIILFLKDKKKSQNINILQKEVWGYSKDLETHTVETHIYRLRKKISDEFKDENFLISSKEGYYI